MDNLTDRILKMSIDRKLGIHPRRFCRRWFGYEDINQFGKPRFTEKQILAIESDRGYRQKSIDLLAEILKIKRNTIDRWGKGVEFNKIPANEQQKYQVYLGYVDVIRIMTISLTQLDERSLLNLLRRLED